MTKEQVKEIKKAYKDILKVCKKHVGSILFQDSDFRDIRDMIESAESHLFLVDWYEKYGIDLRHNTKVSGWSFIRVDDNKYFSFFKNAKEEKKAGSGRYISWSDDDRQPENEWLFCINFSTGAYIFGDDYPQDLFKEFWTELKTYNPKYCDTVNHNMYFSLDNTKKIFEEYPLILKKYYEKNKEDFKLRKIKKMEDELAKLKA